MTIVSPRRYSQLLVFDRASCVMSDVSCRFSRCSSMIAHRLWYAVSTKSRSHVVVAFLCIHPPSHKSRCSKIRRTYLAGLALILGGVPLLGLLGVVRDRPLALAKLLGLNLGRHFGGCWRRKGRLVWLDGREREKRRKERRTVGCRLGLWLWSLKAIPGLSENGVVASCSENYPLAPVWLRLEGTRDIDLVSKVGGRRLTPVTTNVRRLLPKLSSYLGRVASLSIFSRTTN